MQIVYLCPWPNRHVCSLENIMKVSDVMTTQVISISPETSIFVAIELMLKHHISGLPVIDNHAKLVGILSEGDFLRPGRN